MKRILVRAGLSPLDNFSPDYMAEHSNLLGNNSGNMLYAFSVWRALSTEDCELVPTYYRYRYSDEEVDEINETYSAFVIPLANAFRASFQREMEYLTKMIRRLKIPVYVIGVGCNFPFEADLNKTYAFDDTVKDFISAVLDHSSMIGVRGQITADYLSNLGFRQDRDVTVIGCPSMFTYGEDMFVRKTDIQSSSPIAFNHSTQAPDPIVHLINRTIEEFPNHEMVLQTEKEYNLVYAGASYMYNSKRAFPCKRMNDRMYREDRIRFFINVPSWFSYMEGKDLVFGPRLHGCIAGTLAGTPALMLVKDSRMRELAAYHALPHVTIDQITDETTMQELIQSVDLESHLKVHKERFDHFVSFLDHNNIDHIFRYKQGSRGAAPLDKKMAAISYEPGIHTLMGCSEDEKIHRLDHFYEIMWNERVAQAQRLENRNLRIAELKEKLREQKIKTKAEKERYNHLRNLTSVNTALAIDKKLKKLKRK